jgi:hypothetical protein
MLSGISTPRRTRWGCRVPCSASTGYADLAGSRSPVGSALERSYPVIRIMLTVRPNDIKGLGQNGPAMRRATQDLVPATRLGPPIDHPPHAARGPAGATPPLGPPAPRVTVQSPT